MENDQYYQTFSNSSFSIDLPADVESEILDEVSITFKLKNPESMLDMSRILLDPPDSGKATAESILNNVKQENIAAGISYEDIEFNGMKGIFFLRSVFTMLPVPGEMFIGRWCFGNDKIFFIFSGSIYKGEEPLEAWNNLRQVAETAFESIVVKADETPASAPVNLYFSPQATVSSSYSSGVQSLLCAMMYTDVASFRLLSSEVLLFAASIFSGQPGLKRNEYVCKAELQSACDWLVKNMDNQPIQYNALKTWLNSHLQFNLQLVPDELPDELPALTVFPMIPDLALHVPAFDPLPEWSVDFMNDFITQPAYASEIKPWIEALADADPGTALVNHGNDREAGTGSASTPKSMATLIFENYFLLIARDLLEKALEVMDACKYPLAGTENLQTIVQWAADMTVSNGSTVYTNDLRVENLAALNANHPLQSGVPLQIKGLTVKTGSMQSLQSIVSNTFPNYFSAFALVEKNADLPGLLLPGELITVNETEITIQEADTFSTLAKAYFEDDLNYLAVIIETALLAPSVTMTLPDMLYWTDHDKARPDTFSIIASKFRTTPEKIARENATVNNLFKFEAPHHLLNIPSSADFAEHGLNVLNIKSMEEQLARDGGFDNLSEKLAGFLTGGVRLPVTNNITLPAKSTCNQGDLCALYSLTGQQFEVPFFDFSTDAGKYVVNLKAGTHGDWLNLPAEGLTFPGPDPEKQLQLMTWVNSLNTAAQKLDTGIVSITAAETAYKQPASCKMDPPVKIGWSNYLPQENLKGTAGFYIGPVPVIWMFPKSLISIGKHKSLLPAFQVQANKKDLKTNQDISTDLSDYAWSTMLEVGLKKLPTAADDGNSGMNAYKLTGISRSETFLLEKLMKVITRANIDQYVREIEVLYKPKASDDHEFGLLTDGMNNVESFLIQRNSGIQTSLPQGISSNLSAESNTMARGVHGTYDFLKSLWQSGSVHDGESWLYYKNTASQTGLPDYLFDSNLEGSISVMITYTANLEIANYMNCVVTGDPINTANTYVSAVSIMQGKTYSPEPNDTIGSIAGDYQVFPSDLVNINNGTLLSSVPLQFKNMFYEAAAGDTSESIANYFGIQSADLTKSNPGVIWVPFTPLTLLRIPDFSYTPGATTASGQTLSTFAELSTYFHVSYEYLAWIALDVKHIFAEPIEVHYQMRTKTAAMNPGSIGFHVERNYPGDDLSQPSVYLNSQFRMMSAAVAGNQWYKSSRSRTAIKPGDSTGQDPWNYKDAFSVYPFSKVASQQVPSSFGPDPLQNPYMGMGTPAQIKFSWIDLFGNTAIADIDQPQLHTSRWQNNLPVFTGFTDPLTALSDWPGTLSSYQFEGQNLQVQLKFDPQRYNQQPSDAVEMQPWIQNVLHDLNLFQTIIFQLNALKQPAVKAATVSVQTTLDGNMPHVLGGTDQANLFNYLTTAWRYLNALIQDPHAVLTPPADFNWSIAVADETEEVLFPLTVEWVLVRDQKHIDQVFLDVDEVCRSSSHLKPHFQTPALLNTFASTFEAAYATKEKVLKVMTGVPRGAASEQEQIWIVRTGTGPGNNIYWNVSQQLKYFSIIPLSTSLISYPAFQVPGFSDTKGIDWNKGEMLTFQGVDIDNWAQSALGAIEQVLDPSLSAHLFMLDKLNRSQYLQQILKAKEDLATAISSVSGKKISSILSSPALDPVAHAHDFADVAETLRLSLMTSLNNAYSVSAVIQSDVAVSSGYDPFPTDPSTNTQPRLYGLPCISGAENGSSSNHGVTFSPAKIPLNNGKSFLSFTFSANNLNDIKHFSKPISYTVTHLEFDIENYPLLGNYQSSVWLSFIIPPPPVVIQADVPLLERKYPVMPALSNQEASQDVLSANSAADQIELVKKYNFKFQYNQLEAEQDQLIAGLKFNITQDSQSILKETNTADLFQSLGQFITLWPKLDAIFKKELVQVSLSSFFGGTTPPPYFKHSVQAVSAFTQLVQQLANSWPSWEQKKMLAHSLSGSSVQYLVEEHASEKNSTSASAADGSIPASSLPEGSLLVTVTSIGETNPLITAPQLVFDNYKAVTISTANSSATAYQLITDQAKYLSKKQADDDYANRTLCYSGLDVLRIQNVSAGIKVRRNQNLITGNPTHDAFVYTSPQVNFSHQLIPVINSSSQIDIAELATAKGQNLRLSEHLQNLFTHLFANSDVADRNVGLEIVYGHPISPDMPDSNVELPVVLIPIYNLNIPADFKLPAGGCNIGAADQVYICKIADKLLSWFDMYRPEPENGYFRVSMSVFSSLDQTDVPLIRLDSFLLKTKDVNDFN